MPALTVHNAEVKTAAVEVKTLTISGKQVTLAVFRQLQESGLIDLSVGTLHGVPWGFVNYHPDKCGDLSVQSDHRHVVWQVGSELCRSRVDRPSWRSLRFGDNSENVDFYVQATYCLNGHRLPAGFDRRRDTDGQYVAFTLDGLACRTWDMPDQPQPDWVERRHECMNERDLAHATEQLLAEVIPERERRERIDAIWSSLLQLPQLFIAV